MLAIKRMTFSAYNWPVPSDLFSWKYLHKFIIKYLYSFSSRNTQKDHRIKRFI